jgi:hypothetical protein
LIPRRLAYILDTVVIHILILISVYLILALDEFLFGASTESIEAIKVATMWVKASIGLITVLSALIQSIIFLIAELRWQIPGDDA